MSQLDFIKTNNFDYSMKTGVTFSVDILIKNSNNVPMDLTGYAVKIYIYSYRTKIGTINGSISDPLTGKVNFQMAAIDTEKMPLGNYIYHMEYSISGIVTRISEGKIEIRD